MSWRRPILPSSRLPPRRNLSQRPTFQDIVTELQSRPPRIYHDYLVPTSSHLLSLSLPDNPPRHLPSTQQKIDLPQGHHLVYFPPTHPGPSLLPDGTDTDHFPGLSAGLDRRLWTAGRLTFLSRPLSERDLILDGRRAACVERVQDVRFAGDGSSSIGGPDTLDKGAARIYVDIERKYAALPPNLDSSNQAALPTQIIEKHVDKYPAVIENRTLVFLPAKTREDVKADVIKHHAHRKGGLSSASSTNEITHTSIHPSKATFRKTPTRSSPYKPDYTLTLRPSKALLFRFSALSFNAHAIHLDRQYCRQVEGYPDLLVHGPLLCVLMCQALREAVWKLHPNTRWNPAVIRQLSYRNLASLFVDEDLHVHVSRPQDLETGKWKVWVTGPEENLCVKGEAALNYSNNTCKNAT